jgi:hypothetical protein
MIRTFFSCSVVLFGVHLSPFHTSPTLAAGALHLFATRVISRFRFRWALRVLLFLSFPVLHLLFLSFTVLQERQWQLFLPQGRPSLHLSPFYFLIPTACIQLLSEYKSLHLIPFFKSLAFFLLCLFHISFSFDP